MVGEAPASSNKTLERLAHLQIIDQRRAGLDQLVDGIHRLDARRPQLSQGAGNIEHAALHATAAARRPAGLLAYATPLAVTAFQLDDQEQPAMGAIERVGKHDVSLRDLAHRSILRPPRAPSQARANAAMNSTRTPHATIANQNSALVNRAPSARETPRARPGRFRRHRASSARARPP